MKLEGNELLSFIKLYKLFLDRNLENKMSEFVRYKLDGQNVLINYRLSKSFNLTSLCKTTFNYIERSFTSLAKTENFYELEFTEVLKILKSPKLLITSEIEVYKSADRWIAYKKNRERSKFAKPLLLTVRFPLLSDYTLKYLLDKSSSFSEIDACIEILKEISKSKDIFFRNMPSSYYTSRYCNQEYFDILVCGGREWSGKAVGNVCQFNVTDLNANAFPSMAEERYHSKAVCVNQEVYIFGGYDCQPIMSVEKFSPSTNTWIKVADMFDDREFFCACAFMDNIFIIGGGKHNREGYALLEVTLNEFCLHFLTKDCEWNEVAGMNQSRKAAECAVFEEQIIVCGGSDANNVQLDSVESYDVLANTWSPMPSMVAARSFHSLVVVRNKLFVIGEGLDACEVFDKSSNKFIALKFPKWIGFNNALSVGNKIVIIQNESDVVDCYDVDKNEWSEESCNVTNYLENFACVKTSRYQYFW